MKFRDKVTFYENSKDNVIDSSKNKIHLFFLIDQGVDHRKLLRSLFLCIYILFQVEFKIKMYPNDKRTIN